MRIGILSMQRVINYGSFLQSFALKTEMEKRGHEVVFVDIEKKQGYVPVRKSKLQIKLEKAKYIDRYFFRRVKDSKKNTLLNEVLYKAQKDYLKLTDGNMTASGCDAVIIGSDEIFNCSPESVWGINAQRFGDIPDVSKTVSYAASCGYTAVGDMGDEDKEIVASALKKLSVVSVRDDNTRDFVKTLADIEPEMNLDPVLIYDFEKEIAQGEKEGYPDYPYMVVYAYHNRIDSKKEINAIRRYAKENGLKTIAIGGSLPWCDDFAVISPFQVLAYFKHASCIVTDTFHGSVIAAKLNKPLGVLVRESNANKLDDLLKRLKIEKHKASEPDMLKNALNCVDNYEECNEIVAREAEHAQKVFDKAGF